MLALPIVSFAIQALFLIIYNVINMSGGGITPGFAVFTIIVFVACLIMSIVSIVKNAKELRWAVSKARYVTGLVFSIVGTAIGGFFLLGVLIGFAAL